MAAAAPVEPKVQVNQFCQKKTGRQITKTDIVYKTQKHGGSHQSTITLACLGGVAFVGELMATAKAAEAAAASQVLKHYASEIATLAAQPKEKSGTKRPASAMSGVGISGPADKVQKVERGPVPPKLEINEICMKIAKRVLTKNEIVYASKPVAGGFQSTLHLSCLPGVYGQNLFTGTVCQNKKEAETSVATIAVQTLKGDAELAELINKPKEQKPSKGKGKGKFKGKGMDERPKNESGDWDAEWDWGQMNPMMMMSPMMQMMMMSQMSMMGGGAGGGGAKKDAGKRERVSTAKVSGTVADWKGTFGWIKPSKPFEHEMANKHKGDIYLAKSDVPQGTELKAGASLTFHVYVDNSGLGAEDVSM